MRTTLLGSIALMLLSSSLQAQDVKNPIRKASGLDQRVPWTTSRMKGFPEPPPPYKTEPVLPKVTFSDPLDVVIVPKSKRIAIAERYGKIFTLVNEPGTTKADLLLELPKKTVYAIEFHPKQPYLYVTYLPTPEKDYAPKGTRVSRFNVQGNPPKADPASETIIYEWPSGGHNGGCLKFGPDGYLYIATGDGSGIADELQIGQDLSSVFGKILRIDVDRPAAGKNYSIPADNPFLKTPGALPEVYAYGLRQIWRFSFDSKAGHLWAGEVGQDLWEMVYKIERGGNYGWSVQEGLHPFRPERKKGPTPILKPVVEHSHAEFRSITGGYVYHGKRLPALDNTYIYGDFDTGRIWGLKVDGERLTFHGELATTTLRIVSWVEDHDGELLFLDFMGGGLHRLVKAPKVEATFFPRKLSETGVFASTKDHKVAAGVIPYSVNAQLWGDHAIKDRFLAIPGDGKIGLDEITYPASLHSPPGWRFPDGSILVKTFSMEMERGNPASKKRLETRLLHFQQFQGTQDIGDQYWRGYTYIWNDDQTDAELLDEKGLDKVLKIKVAGKETEQKYRFPSRAECTLCHTNAAKFALGVTTMQLNRDHNYDGVIANQLATFNHIGLFSKPMERAPSLLPQLVDFEDEKQPLELRARSYLQSNCAHCHMKWAGGNAEFKLLSTLSLADMGILGTPPAHGSFDIKGAKLIEPGAPDRSLIPARMARTGLGRMPHIGSHVPDEKAVNLIREWIAGMKK